MATAQMKSDKKVPANKSSKTKSSAGDGRKTSAAKSLRTTNHDEIRSWVEKRNGTPSMVNGTDAQSNETGILRIDFPGYSGKDTLENISWEDFFKKFDESKLEFPYQNETASGRESRFSKFVAGK